MDNILHSELDQLFVGYFKEEYGKFIDSLIDEAKKETGLIDYSKYTLRTVYKPEEIAKEFLKKEGLIDYTITDNSTFSLHYSFLLQFRSYNERINLDSKLFNEITRLNKSR